MMASFTPRNVTAALLNYCGGIEDAMYTALISELNIYTAAFSGHVDDTNPYFGMVKGVEAIIRGPVMAHVATLDPAVK